MTGAQGTREGRLRQTDRMLKQGLSLDEIAKRLDVQRRTVSGYAQELATHPLPDENDVFGLVIYQNPEYVSALLQQLFAIGLPVEEFAETFNAGMRQRTTEAGINGGAKFGLKLPFIPDASAHVDAEARTRGGSEDKNEQRQHQKFLFTQANYLHNVRAALDERGLVFKVAGANTLDQLRSGVFVEFSASFEPNEVNSILDLATPELVAAIVKHRHKTDALEAFDFDSSHEARQAFAMKVSIEADSKAELAAAATVAVRQDFRNETTREYFGTIRGIDKSSVTAVTICDTEYFLNQDKDRILDGTFRVLGKIAEISMEPVSILSRNKFLNRMRQSMLDDLTERLDALTQDGQFDASLKLGLVPPVLKVIPIAIYL
ncbi:hypothetical protein [Arthrobacter sp. CJ23]|uniref:DUF6414 family protein n=1 Tax=Arthrobacter sp. CJ23 TaxID=2972479 RepID=UPI00215D00CF|nr:hypothetical protein [Arthrobacter sp. CJ23]UVJ39049.1 hypothetical protein NVV90_17840 [Arthrobacter sp. CJ23]